MAPGGVPLVFVHGMYLTGLSWTPWAERAGGALIGPHRSDLSVSLAEKGIAAELASTGEQKALLISILLAHTRLQQAVRGEPPLLLLDEIAAHLDPIRRAALFDALLRLDSQAWLTGTDAALFAPRCDC